MQCLTVIRVCPLKLALARHCVTMIIGDVPTRNMSTETFQNDSTGICKELVTDELHRQNAVPGGSHGAGFLGFGGDEKKSRRRMVSETKPPGSLRQSEGQQRRYP